MTKRTKVSADFRPLKAGSDRAKIVGYAEEGKTVDEIVRRLGTYRGNVLTTLYCLKRDKRIVDFAVAEDDTLKLKLPRGVTPSMLVGKG